MAMLGGSTLSAGDALHNLFYSTIGNVVGGVVLVELPFAYLNRANERSNWFASSDGLKGVRRRSGCPVWSVGLRCDVSGIEVALPADDRRPHALVVGSARDDRAVVAGRSRAVRHLVHRALIGRVELGVEDVETDIHQRMRVELGPRTDLIEAEVRAAGVAGERDPTREGGECRHRRRRYPPADPRLISRVALSL